MTNLEKVINNPYSLYNMTDEEQTEDICLAAISSKGSIIQYISETKLTLQMCIISIKKDIKNFKFIPDNFKNEEFYLQYIKKDASKILEVPKELRNDFFNLDAIIINKNVINYLDEEEQTYDICFSVIKKDKKYLSKLHLSKLKEILRLKDKKIINFKSMSVERMIKKTNRYNYYIRSEKMKIKEKQVIENNIEIVF